MEAFKRAAGAVGRMWSGLSTSRRVILCASLAAAGAIIAWGLVAASSGGMVKVAGAELTEDERAQIVRRLKEKNQRFEVVNREIYLPAGEAERVMFELNADGVFSDEVFYKYVLESNILDTGADKERKFLIGLQRKLERMVRNVKGVRNAAVQITPQAETGLFRETAKAGASVQVELAPGHSLSAENVNAIAGMVARAVRGLDPERVHVMDTSGRAYRVRKADERAQTADEVRRLEAEQEDQIEAKLKNLFPGAQFVVRVKARSSDIHTEEIKNSNPLPKVEEERRIQEAGAAAAAAAPGIKGAAEAPPEAAVWRPQAVREVKIENYVDVMKRVVRDPAGAVEKITVGALIPVREDALERERRNEAQYRDIIRQAVGPLADDKSVSIMFVPTRPPAPLPEPTFWEGTRDMLSGWWPALLAAVLALAVLCVLVALRRRAPAEPVAAEDLLGGARAGVEDLVLPAPGVPLSDRDVARVGLSLKEMVERSPGAVAGILRRWLGGRRES